MKSNTKNYLALLSVLFLTFSCRGTEGGITQQTQNDKTVVDFLGLIHVKGNMIVDKNDTPVALHGMSLFWSQWGGSFYNENCVRWLRDDWKCTIVRAACGVESGGYLENPQAEFAKVTAVIDACIKLGIYVVVDWHDHNAQDHLEEAKEFFQTIAQKYGDKSNVIYEVYNEPLQVSWSGAVKPYAEAVIGVIRQYDPDNLIVVGTPTWSQDVDVAARNPIIDSNVAYAFHFYTSTHKQPLRNKAIAAMNSGVALFVTEFGISEASGTGNIDYAETGLWLSFLDQYKLSSCNWSIMDKDETSAALRPGSSPLGGWGDTDLSVSGAYMRSQIRMVNDEIWKAVEASGG
jgi:endoglucanase